MGICGSPADQCGGGGGGGGQAECSDGAGGRRRHGDVLQRARALLSGEALVEPLDEPLAAPRPPVPGPASGFEPAVGIKSEPDPGALSAARIRELYPDLLSSAAAAAAEEAAGSIAQRAAAQGATAGVFESLLRTAAVAGADRASTPS